jgi:hypothetical protein
MTVAARVRSGSDGMGVQASADDGDSKRAPAPAHLLSLASIIGSTAVRNELQFNNPFMPHAHTAAAATAPLSRSLSSGHVSPFAPMHSHALDLAPLAAAFTPHAGPPTHAFIHGPPLSPVPSIAHDPHYSPSRDTIGYSASAAYRAQRLAAQNAATPPRAPFSPHIRTIATPERKSTLLALGASPSNLERPNTRGASSAILSNINFSIAKELTAAVTLFPDAL